MRTQDEIVARIRAVADTDLLGFRFEVLAVALDFEHARPFIVESATANDWTTLDAESVDQSARDYYAFALGKIKDHRGISAHRSVEKLQEFAWLLVRDDVLAEMEAADYEQYGAPKVKAFGAGFGLEWPATESMTRMANGEPCHPECDEGCEG